MKDLAVVALLAGGTFFMVVSAIGVVRLPDLYTRMHAATKSASLGASLALAGLALHFSTAAVTARSVAAILFIFLTIPLAGHLMGRAAYMSGVPLWERTCSDELKGQYDRRAERLGSGGVPPRAGRGEDREEGGPR